MTPEQLKYSILKFAFSGKLVASDTDAELPNIKVIDFEEEPFDIPESWIWSTLGNCCEMYTGNSISESVKKAKYTGITDGLDYIATKDVTFENSIIYDNGVRIPLSDGFRIAKTGSVLMCVEGGSAGRKIGITDRDVCFGNKLCMFNSTVIINKYIYYYLQSSEFKNSFSGNMSGIIGGVSIKKLKEIPIPVPPINEQNCIVKKIEELLSYVERYSVSHEKLEQFNTKFPEDMRKSILQYAIQGKLVEQRAEEGTGEETEKFRSIYPGVTDGEPIDYNTIFYVQFSNTGNVQSRISDLKAQFGLTDEQVSENTKLLGLLGQSANSFMMQVYIAAAVLFVLVLFAGIMMIASSLNSNVAQRTEFFGLMRCIGATPKQVMRLVRKEALGWCRFAIPVGVLCGIVLTWILCFVLRFLSPEYFGAMPAFSISVPSILSGIVVGVLTVLLSARAPAKRASKVSPLSAVSGNANDLQPVRKAANTKRLKVDTSLGIHHAKSSRKNFVLMVGSFALSIVLFLAFSVTITFMNHTLTPLYPWAPDISIVSPDNTCSVDRAFIGQLKENPIVDAVYGRMFAYDVPIIVNGTEKKVILISYEQQQFEWASDYLQAGSLETVQNELNTGLTVYDSQGVIQPGDKVAVEIGGQTEEIEIVGMLSTSPFNSAGDAEIIICSEDTFRQITGEENYTIIDMQLSSNVTDADVNAIHRTYGAGFNFVDKRIDNSSTLGIYYCVWLFLYGFLILIALITVFNVINSIALSVAARTKQYGAFRAIGLSTRQLSKMVIAEASTYAIVGCIIGTLLGLFCNKILFNLLISSHWGDPWTIPWTELGIIILIVALSVILAVHGPIKKIRGMSIVDTISAQ